MRLPTFLEYAIQFASLSLIDAPTNGIVRFFKFEQSANAPLPIEVTLLGTPVT